MPDEGKKIWGLHTVVILSRRRRISETLHLAEFTLSEAEVLHSE